MVTMVLISPDVRLRSQVETWSRELTGESRGFESYRSIAEFKSSVDVGVAEALAAAQIADSGSGKSPFKIIRLIVLDLDLFPVNPEQQINELKAHLSEKASILFDADRLPYLMGLGFDTGPGSIKKFSMELIQAIDDMVLKPLDKTLYLQKSEFLLAKDYDVDPSYLFRAQVTKTIEIGEDIELCEVSELSVTVLSRERVEPGLFSYLHCDVFGKGANRRLLARAIACVAAPPPAKASHRNFKFKIQYNYFCLQQEQLSSIRRFVRVRQESLKDGSEGREADAPSGMSDQLQKKLSLHNLKLRRIAVIEVDQGKAEEMKKLLENGFKAVNVLPFSSFARLAGDIGKLVPKKAKEGEPLTKAAPDVPTYTPPLVTAFPFGRKVSLTMAIAGRALFRLDAQLKPDDLMFGAPAQNWLKTPDSFIKSVYKEDLALFNEFVELTKSAGSAKIVFRLVNSANEVFYMQGEGLPEKLGKSDSFALIKITLNEIDEKRFKEAFAAQEAFGLDFKDPSTYNFDAVVIDSSYLGANPQHWITAFTLLLRAASVIGPAASAPKIFILKRESSTEIKLSDWQTSEIVDCFIHPFDRRYIVQRFNSALSGLLPIEAFEPSPPEPASVEGQLTRQIEMAEVSEYGLSVHDSESFAPGALRFFFDELFGQTGWVAAKAYETEALPSRPGMSQAVRYHGKFMFFGVYDDFLQKVRRWIREDYVEKKSELDSPKK